MVWLLANNLPPPLALLDALRFTGSYSPVWIFALAAALAVGGGLIYLRESRHLRSPYAYLLPALRSTAIALTVLLLAGPVWHRETVIGTLGRVIFAVDTSASMSVSDGSVGGASRLQRAIELLAGSGLTTSDDSDGWIGSLAETHQIDLVAFDAGSPTVLWSSRANGVSANEIKLSDIEASGTATDLNEPLRLLTRGTGRTVQSAETASAETASAQQEPSGDPAVDGIGAMTALVLMTDGRSNVRSSFPKIAPSEAVVHAVGFGAFDEPPDAGILSISHPETIAIDGRLAGEIRLKRTGLDEPIQVRIETSDGRQVWSKTIAPTESAAVAFEMDVNDLLSNSHSLTAGERDASSDSSFAAIDRQTEVLDLVAVVQGPPADTIDANDSFPLRVSANRRDRRLLLLDGSPRWETRYLRNLFARDSTYSVETILFGPGTDSGKLQRGNTAGTFPDSDTAMNRFDAIILGEIPPDQLTAEDAQRIENFVTRGGGLIFIDGRYGRLSGLAKGPLGSLLPVSFESNGRTPVQSIAPAPAFSDHPIFDLTQTETDIREFWQSLPPPSAIVETRASPAAEVWASAETIAGGELPFLVSRLFGSGRVFYFAGDETWRWRYKVADRFHARFWNQVLSAAMQPPYAASDQFASIATDKIQYRPGDSSAIRVRMRGADGAAVGDATVDALLMSDGVLRATIPLTPDDPTRGTYRGETESLPAGKYEVGVRASGFDTRALKATTSIWVDSDAAAEWSRVSLDEANLRRIAGDLGGEYFDETSADELLDRLRPLSSGRIVSTDLPLWQSWWWFAAIVGLLSLEWLLRKRVSLI